MLFKPNVKRVGLGDRLPITIMACPLIHATCIVFILPVVVVFCQNLLMLFFVVNDMFVLESLNSFVMNLVSVPICVNFTHFWFCVLCFFLPYSFSFI
jgi:hypothetical protein